MTDRAELSRLLAKAIAFHAVGKHTAAREHAELLIAALRAEGILE